MGGLKLKIDQLRAFTKLPIAVGFGIKTPAQVQQVGAFADAVVVGSALVDIIGKIEQVENEDIVVETTQIYIRPFAFGGWHSLLMKSVVFFLITQLH